MKTTALSVAAIALLALTTNTSLGAQEKNNYIFVHHATPGNVFWQAVKAGMDDACNMVDADCHMIFLQTQDGNLQEVLANLEAAVAQQPDGIITSIMNPDSFDEPIQRAVDQDIPVISVNVDDIEGADGNARLAFVGQNLEHAGYELGKAATQFFPAEGPVHVLLGISDPGQTWAEQRVSGLERFFADYAAANPDRQITWDAIDSGIDYSVTGSRIAAYLQANPNTTAYLGAGFWYAGAVQALKDLGYEKGEVLLGGFDLVPKVLEEMESGWIQVTVDQQPYLQGFLPIMQLHLMKTLKLGKWDVNTGNSMIYREDAGELLGLSNRGFR